MKKIIFSLIISLFMLNEINAQTTIKLRDEAETPYKIVGKLVSEMTNTDKETSKVYMSFDEKSKSFSFSELKFDKQGLVERIEITTLPVAKMNFKTDGYGSRSEESENDYYGKGKIANVTLLCQGQESCFSKQEVDAYEVGKIESKNVTFFNFYVKNKKEGDAILKEVTSKK